MVRNGLALSILIAAERNAIEFTPYDDKTDSTWRNEAHSLHTAGMIEPRVVNVMANPKAFHYHLTDKGKAFMAYIYHVYFPQQVISWEIPKDTDA